jgi:hypothetical protein
MKTLRLLLLAIVVAALHCGINPNDGTGSSTESITAMLYNPDGSLAVSAKVCFYRHHDDPRNNHAVDSTYTDNNGNYKKDLDTGTYNILATLDTNATFQDSVIVTEGDTTRPPPDTLRSLGSISGKIELLGTDDPRTVFILFMGSNTFTRPTDLAGNFTATNMAKGKYPVSLLTTLDDYAVMDTSFVITAGLDSVIPQPIVMTYTGIPVPKGLRIEYDTMMQIVTLYWNTPTTGRPLSGYNIYRKHQDSALVLLRADWTDTTYNDSTGMQDQTYEYRVAVVDTQNTTGVMSSGISVTVVSAFTIVDSIANGSGTNDGQFGYLVHAAMDSSEYFYIVDTKNKWLQKIDSAGQFIFKFVSLQYPRGITIDNLNDVLYVSDSQRRLIIKLTLSGDTLLSWQPVNAPGGIIYHAGKLYVSLPDTGIQVYDSVGTEIAFYNYQFKRHNSDNINFCLDSNGKMYVADAENILELDTSSGILTPIYSIINFDQNQDPDIEFVDGNTIIIATRGAPVPYQSRLYFIDKNTGVQKGIWKSNEAITDMVYSTIQHRMFVFTSSGKILFCQLNL